MNAPSGNVPIVLSNHISVKDAAKLSGYSVQYLRRLLRSRELEGVKIGQQWLVEMRALNILSSQECKYRDKRFGPQNKG